MSLIEGYIEPDPVIKAREPKRDNESKKRQISNTYHCSCGAKFSGKGHYKIALLHTKTISHTLAKGRTELQLMTLNA